MSDDPTQHDELRRRLAEQGAAPAPPELADEVMRRVRAEPRPRQRPTWLRPTLALVAAAVLVVAALVGISRIGSASSSSSGSSAARETAGPASSSGAGRVPSTAPPTATALVHGVPAAHLQQLFGLKSASGVPSDTLITCQPARIDVRVPSALYDSLQARLRHAAATGSSARRVTVVLHRGGAAVRTLRVTCP
jgi:hypothetical protein